MATHSSILAWEIPWTEGAWWAIVHVVPKESNTTQVTEQFYIMVGCIQVILSLRRQGLSHSY